MNTNAFHERPLVAFTTLGVIGAGLLTAPLLALASQPGALLATSELHLLAGTILLAVGLAVSLAHLGRPQRAALALARVGRSRLSNEAAAGCAAVAAGVAALVFPRLPLLAALAAAAGIVFLVTLGRVYDLPGQRTWRGAAAWTPLAMGLGVGVLALADAGHRGVWAVAPVGAAVLAADAALFSWARRDSFREARAARHSDTDSSTGLLVGRFLLVDIAPPVLALAGLLIMAGAALALGILADRAGFYLLGRQHTTEAEITRVERLME